MNKFCLQVMLLLGCLCSLYSNEENYKQHVKSSNWKSVDGIKTIQIILNDNTIWNVVSEAYDKKVLFHLADCLAQNRNMVVYFEPLENTKLFLLNLRIPTKWYHSDIALVVELSAETKQFLKIRKIEKIKLTDSADGDYGYRFFLTDGSTWEIMETYASIYDHWKIGDRIVPTWWLYAYWQLINIDCGYMDELYFDDRDCRVNYIQSI